MSEGEDFTFMKSGFNNLVEKDETFENTAAVIMVFMENAVKQAALYVSHTNRKVITQEDVKRGLMLELFLMGKRDDNLEKCLSMKENIKQWINDENDEDDEEEEENEDEDVEFEESKCECPICNVLNNIYDRWDTFQPSSDVEKIIHKHLSNM